MELAGLNKLTKPEHRWKFQGQEEQKEFGLNWSSFKWRNADVALGRFHSVDPLAEQFYYNSVYAFSENKVVVHFELEGLESVYSNGDDEYFFWKKAAEEEGPGLIEGGKKALETTGKGLLTVGMLRVGIMTPAGQANLLGQSIFQFGYAAYEGEPLINAAGRIDEVDGILASFGWIGLGASALIDYTPEKGLQSLFQSGEQHKPLENVLLDGGINGSLKFVSGKISASQAKAAKAKAANDAEMSKILKDGEAAFGPRWQYSPSIHKGAPTMVKKLQGLQTSRPTLRSNLKAANNMGVIVNTYSTNIVGKSTSGTTKKQMAWVRNSQPRRANNLSQKKKSDIINFLQNLK